MASENAVRKEIDSLAWPPRCSACGRELGRPGALVFGPPQELIRGIPASEKLHVCGEECWDKLVRWFRSGSGRPYSRETIAAYARIIEVGFGIGDEAKMVPTGAMLVALRHLAMMVHCDLTGELREPHTHLDVPEEPEGSRGGAPP